MKMTTKGKYAVSIMCGLSESYKKDGTAQIQTKDIARQHYLSRLYVEQLLNKLKKASLVNSSRGPKGGYCLSRPPAKIKIGEVIEATEGPISLVACVVKGSDGKCSMSAKCKTKEFWSDLSRVIENKLDSTTLADLC